MKLMKYIIAVFCVFLLNNTNSYSYENKIVHPEINDKAVQQSRLDQALKYIGFPYGASELIKNIYGEKKEVLDCGNDSCIELY